MQRLRLREKWIANYMTGWPIQRSRQLRFCTKAPIPGYTFLSGSCTICPAFTCMLVNVIMSLYGIVIITAWTAHAHIDDGYWRHNRLYGMWLV